MNQFCSVTEGKGEEACETVEVRGGLFQKALALLLC